MTNHDLIKKVIGNINSIGESNTDAERFKNLKETCKLISDLLNDIDSLIYNNKDAHQASIKKCVDYAENFLEVNIRDFQTS